jgi:H+/gluconate symporter-like permease
MKRPITLLAVAGNFSAIAIPVLAISIRFGAALDALVTAVPLVCLSVGLVALHPLALRAALWLSRVSLLAAAVIAFCAIVLPSSATLHLGDTVKTAADAPLLIGFSLGLLMLLFGFVQYALTRDHIAELFDR